MAYRIKRLTLSQGIHPDAIQVLMFNRNAQKEFVERLNQIQLPCQFQPKVNTFHSYAYSLINDPKHAQIQYQYWTGEHEYRHDIALNNAYNAVKDRTPETEHPLLPEIEECERAIDLWKGKLIPPERAGYSAPMGQFVIDIYKEYERNRAPAPPASPSTTSSLTPSPSCRASAPATAPS